MVRFSKLEIHKEEFAFSAGHFTIFSATEREHLHGHNYNVSVAFKVRIEKNGLSFDYRHYKKKMLSLCDKLDRRFLLPSESPYLQLEDAGEYWVGHFNQQKIPLPKDDVSILPLTNITIEELSHWFLKELIRDEAEIANHAIHGISIKVYNSPGQSAAANWGEAV